MFKDTLRQLRIERNLTQVDVAKALGVTAATIGNYEQGLREPRNLEMWQKIADYFDVPVNYLMETNSKKERKDMNKKLVYIVICSCLEEVNGDEPYYIDSVWTSKRKAEKRCQELNDDIAWREECGYYYFNVECHVIRT